MNRLRTIKRFVPSMLGAYATYRFYHLNIDKFSYIKDIKIGQLEKVVKVKVSNVPFAPVLKSGYFSQFSILNYLGKSFFTPKNHNHDFEEVVYTMKEGDDEKEIGKKAFALLKEHATPPKWSSEQIEENVEVRQLVFVGPVITITDIESWSLTNQTISGHILNDGYVKRSVVIKDNKVYVRTEGGGTGPFSAPNDFFAPYLWGYVNKPIIEGLNKE